MIEEDLKTAAILEVGGLFEEMSLDFNWDDPAWQAQLTLPYPKYLRDHGTGHSITYYTNGTDTYYETSGAYANAGPYMARGHTFSDDALQALHELHCKLEIKETGELMDQWRAEHGDE
tara:strand:- start:2803 stop:3156 length:354 start_codon:yes stop_codon:yes gene_type:complete